MVEQYVLAILSISSASLVISIVALSYTRKFKNEANRLRTTMETLVRLTSRMEKPVNFSIPRKRKKRYIVFRVISEKIIGLEEIEKSVRKSMSKLYGEPSLKESMFSLVYYNESTGYGILRISSEWKNRTITALGFVRDLGDKKMLVIPIRSTGTIKRAKRFLFERLR